VSENGSLAPNGVWKWITAILVAILIAGAPGMVQAIKAPSQEEVDLIRERQVQVLIRLAAIDEQLEVNEALITDLQAQVRAHQQDVLNGR
jgi:uncharacterized protein YpmS